MPERFFDWTHSPDTPHPLPATSLELAVAVAAGLVLAWVVVLAVRRIVRRTPWGIDNVLHQYLRGPTLVLIPLLAMMLVRSRQRMLGSDLPTLDRTIQLLLVAAITWAAVRVVASFVAYMKQEHRVDVPDNGDARRIHTQVTVIGRSIQVLVIIVGLAAALMTFPLVQQIGTSLLASAGLAGLAIGLAARPVLENLIAGVQIGLTQPVRLDDVVIVDGEWGRVEEITLTYVVVKIWDERRLILPFSKFITDSFQNWTRNGSNIMGTVMLHLDYTAPIDAIKNEAKRIVEASPLWDKRVFAAQVTELTDRAVQLRILVSATDSPTAFDLRVSVREQLLAYVSREHPQSLPLARVDVQSDDPHQQVTR